VFVLPSHWEGMPNSVLEAMAAGAPVVATGVDGTLDVVEDGVTGLLVPPGDPAALARALNDLLHQPDRRTALAAAATRAVETRFSLEAMIDAYLFLYTELLPVPRHA
jgi:glycosyltransferase involved in cell wall biosynthesis